MFLHFPVEDRGFGVPFLWSLAKKWNMDTAVLGNHHTGVFEQQSAFGKQWLPEQPMGMGQSDLPTKTTHSLGMCLWQSLSFQLKSSNFSYPHNIWQPDYPKSSFLSACCSVTRFPGGLSILTCLGSNGPMPWPTPNRCFNIRGENASTMLWPSCFLGKMSVSFGYASIHEDILQIYPFIWIMGMWWSNGGSVESVVAVICYAWAEADRHF